VFGKSVNLRLDSIELVLDRLVSNHYGLLLKTNEMDWSPKSFRVLMHGNKLKGLMKL